MEVLAGLSLKAAAEKLRLPFALETGHRLRRGLRRKPDGLRPRRAGRGGPPTVTPEALALIVRSGEGRLRRTRNLCLGSLIETVRDQTRIVDLKQVNRVRIQPRWRKDCDQPIAS